MANHVGQALPLTLVNPAKGRGESGCEPVECRLLQDRGLPQALPGIGPEAQQAIVAIRRI